MKYLPELFALTKFKSFDQKFSSDGKIVDKKIRFLLFFANDVSIKWRLSNELL